MTVSKWNKILVTLIVLSAAIIVSGFLSFWRIGYNSDFAMMGLMAKRILDHGEFPIFVWQVGYQGVLLEASAIALAFKLFGLSPYSLNLAPAFFFPFLLYFFFRAVRMSFERSTALLATLLVVVSCPAFYASVLRTQPNYVETFTFGMMIFSLYLSLVRSLYVEAKPIGRNQYLQIGALGFLCGFGWYTYGQIIYFMAAVVMHFSLIYWRERPNASAIFGNWKALLLFVVAALVGDSPKLYFNWVLHGHSLNQMGLARRWGDILNHVGIAFQGNAIFFRFSGWSWTLGMVLIGSIGIFLWTSTVQARAFISGRLDKSEFLKLSPFYFLFFSATLMFLVARQVTDLFSSRYLLVLILFYAVALAWAVERLFPKARKAVGIALLLVLCHRSYLFYSAFKNAPRTSSHEEVITYLNSKGVTRAYGDYWQAYAVTFLSQEKIIVEPVYSNYNPYYAEPVRNESRIAYLDSPPYKIPIHDGIAEIDSRNYQVLERESRGDTDIFILQKL